MLQIAIFMYWTMCLVLSIVILIYQILLKSQATNSTRKHFHVLATFVYIPGMIYDPSLLYLASGMMLVLFIVLEVFILIATYCYTSLLMI